MKQVVIISGKGGTGKTMVTASLAALDRHAVVADCDVDAANLHLLLHSRDTETHLFKAGHTAVIDPERCTHCGICREVCRFAAISPDYRINPFACEGCGVCYHLCPEKAIALPENLCGEWSIGESDYGPMVHAKLYAAQENSGHLVSIVRKRAHELALNRQKELILIDGPPGIGCPVISSLTGTDLALVVTEPSQSGWHDLARVAELTSHFHIPTAVCVNKADIYPRLAEQIADYCEENGLEFIGVIPYDTAVVDALVRQQPVVESGPGPAAKQLSIIWQRLQDMLAMDNNVCSDDLGHLDDSRLKP